LRGVPKSIEAEPSTRGAAEVFFVDEELDVQAVEAAVDVQST